MIAKFEKLLVPYLIGLVPSLILLLTWDSEGVNSPVGRGLREYAPPILAVEGIVTGLAFVAGLLAAIRRSSPFLIGIVVIWLAVAWATAMFAAPRPELSAFLTGAWTLHLLFGVAVAHLTRIGELDGDMLGPALLVGFLSYAALLSAFVLRIPDPGDFEWVRALPGLGNIRRVGAYTTVIIGLCIGMLAAQDRARLWPVAGASAAFAVAFWSGSRGTFLAVGVGSVACCLMFPKMRRADIFLTLLFAAALGFAMAWLFPVSIESAGAGRLLADQSLSGREDIWPKVIHEIMQQPWFGHGEGQTAMILPRDPGRAAFHAHAHNLVLQLLFAWGVVGTICVALFAWAVARPIVRQAREGDVRLLPMMGGAACLLVHSMVDGALYDVAPVALFAALVGAAAGLTRMKPASPEPNFTAA
jgi:O-antigen ligase